MPEKFRWDHNLIYDLVKEGSSVLDLGCGAGDLLARLATEKKIIGQAVEADPRCAAEAIQNGVSVYQKNLDLGLPEFKTKSYDYVILEKTVQQLQRPLLVLEEILRIGKTIMVSFPNFSYHKVTAQLLERDRMPVTPVLPHKWYDTPNIHLFTLADFMDYLRESRVKVLSAYAAEDAQSRPLKLPDDYREAEELLFVLKSSK